MRFLLKLKGRAAAEVRDANNLLTQSQKTTQIAITKHLATDTITGKAWGQHCSSDCGCILRFELQLSNNHPSPALSTTETIVSATYHAKRVMVTHCAYGESSSSSKLRPLLTSEYSSKTQRPILTSCTCSTLHEIAQQIVSHLPGRTLQQLRNEAELGVVGARSSIAFRHTVLRENVLPVISMKRSNRSWKKFGDMFSFSSEQQQSEDGTTDNNGNGGGAKEMNSTQRYGHCFDLVEDSLLSMIHERRITPRRDDNIHAYSPTMGAYFRMYSPSRRWQQKQRHVPLHHSLEGDDFFSGRAMKRNDSFVANSWLQTSPSSYFLFGDESSTYNSTYSDGLLNLFVDYAKESIFGRNDNAITTEAARAPVVGNPSNYLQLLDMYGDNHSDDGDREEDELDDWLDYVDTMQSQGRTSSG